MLDHAERRLGYRPNLQEPKTFNEKMNWRKVYDRNPLFPLVSDKILVRDFVRDRIGASSSENVLTDLYATTVNPKTFAYSSLPQSFVAKANHASGWNILVTPDSPIDVDVMRKELCKWLRRSYGKMKQEWAYQEITRKVLFEEYVQGSNGRVPSDMKFMFFNEECAFSLLIDDRFGSLDKQFLRPDWTRITTPSGIQEQIEIPPKPALYDDMLQIANKLAKGFDCVRVDFLFTDTRIIVNELTLYRGSGMTPFLSPDWDDMFGKMWTLPTQC